MKFLGIVKDPKDLTTKEYVDNADTELMETLEDSVEELDNKKVNSDDLQEFTDEEIQALWNKHIK